MNCIQWAGIDVRCFCNGGRGSQILAATYTHRGGLQSHWERHDNSLDELVELYLPANSLLLRLDCQKKERGKEKKGNVKFTSLHWLFLLLNCSFSYNGEFFNGKYKRRTLPINMSMRDEGLSVMAV